MSTETALHKVRQLTAAGRYPEAARACLAVLREDPAQVEANLLYGDLAINMRRPHDAIVIFRKLLTVAPSHPVAHDRLAFLYASTSDYYSASQHARAALQLDPGAIESRLALGTYALLQGDERAGLEMFEAARERAPGNPNVEREYANALLYCGDFEAARDVVRGLIDREPGNPQLYNLLSRCKSLRADDPDAKLIASLVDNDEQLLQEYAAPDDRAAAFMALYKLHSDLGEPAAAFRFLSRAKSIAKTQLPYQHDRVTKARDKLQAVFSDEFFKQHAQQSLGSTTDAPVFIVSMPRAGSTLLEQLLASHPDITAAGELPLIGRLLQETCARFGDNQHDLNALERMPPAAWQQIGDEYLRRARQRIPGSGHFIDKMPGNFAILGFIRAALPQAKIIHLARHPAANCLSIYETDFEAEHAYANDLQWLGQFFLAYRQSMDYWRDRLGEALIDVSYEDLVKDTDTTLGRLGDRLGLRFEKHNIEAAQQEGHILTASAWQARQPVHRASLDRWRQYAGELQPLLAILAPILPAQD